MLLEMTAVLALMCQACEERAASPFGFPFARPASQGSGPLDRTDGSGPAADLAAPKAMPVAAPPSPAPNPGPDETPGITPKMIKRVDPVYPIEALRNDLEGRVIVRFQIAPDGVPVNAAIHHSENPVFDQPVLRALSQSRFEPQPEGKPVYAGRWFKQPYAFRLEPELPPPSPTP